MPYNTITGVTGVTGVFKLLPFISFQEKCWFMKVPKCHMEDSSLSKEISMTISLSIFTHCDCSKSENIMFKVYIIDLKGQGSKNVFLK